MEEWHDEHDDLITAQETINIYLCLTISMLVLIIAGINILSVASFATQVKEDWSKWFNISINVWLVLFFLVGLASIIFEFMWLAKNSELYWQMFTTVENSYDQNTMAWIATIVCKCWLYGMITFNVSRKTLKCCQRCVKEKEVDAIPLEIAE